jgi:hypothetical protein
LPAEFNGVCAVFAGPFDLRGKHLPEQRREGSEGAGAKCGKATGPPGIAFSAASRISSLSSALVFVRRTFLSAAATLARL